MVPACELWNFTPSATALGSLTARTAGASLPLKRLLPLAPATVTETPALGASMLTLSSVARERNVQGPAVPGVHKLALPTPLGVNRPLEGWLAFTVDGLEATARAPDLADPALARLGLAVTRGLLLDLIATDDDAGVAAAAARFTDLLRAASGPAPPPGDGDLRQPRGASPGTGGPA